MLPIAMGNSDFREIREKGWYYVDKSLLIRELLQDASKVVLIPRPRRFGKTLNFNMCEAFFSDQAPNRQLFEGLAIADDAEAMQHFGAYPTIAMTFKDLHADSWESCQIKVQSLISRLFHKYKDRIQPDTYQQRLIQEYLDRRAPIALVEEALRLLSDLLYQSTGKKVFLLIDEYDAPIQDGHFYGFYDKIVAFCRGFFGPVLKDYPYLHKGVLTGVLRIAQESLFSGLNNIQVSTVLDQGYSNHFGFTEVEVKKIIEDYELGDQESEIRNWYNGYRIGASTLYNPWSILSVAARRPETLESYWINTSQDKLIENLITTEHCISLEDLTHLLSGEGLVKEIWPALSLNRIDGRSIWSLLLFSGYVTFVRKESETRYVLRLPNREVRFYFERIVRRWIEGSSGQIESLRELLIQGRLDAFQNYFSDRVIRLVGQNDTGGRSEPENFYHGLVLGLFAYGLDDIYEITSNREAGLGRYDLQLKPRIPGPPAYIFEFKSIRKDQDQDITIAAKAAVDQIREKQYTVELKRSVAIPLWLVGIAFSGKALKMYWQLEQPYASPKLGRMHDSQLSTAIKDNNDSDFGTTTKGQGPYTAKALPNRVLIWIRTLARILRFFLRL